MKTAIVTGASRGIGLAIAKCLVEKDYIVYAISRDFSKTEYEHTNFNRITCDLSKIDMLTKVAQEIKRNIESLNVLVNNAGVGYFGRHENLTNDMIVEMCSVNLIAPLILCREFMSQLKNSRGAIINITSITAKKVSPFGAAYSATKIGLYHFGRAIFEESRKQGIKVINICPDVTKTNFFDRLDFMPSESPEAYLTPDCIRSVIDFALSTRQETVITEIELRPQILSIKKRVSKFTCN